MNNAALPEVWRRRAEAAREITMRNDEFYTTTANRKTVVTELREFLHRCIDSAAAKDSEYRTEHHNNGGKMSDSRRGPLWDVLHAMKGHDDLRTLGASEALAMIEAADPDIWDHAFIQSRASAEDARIDLLKTWERIICPAGHLERAVTMAGADPIITDDPGRTKSYLTLLNVAAWLQRMRPDAPIILPQKRLGALMGISQRSVSTLCTWAMEDGYLTMERGGRYTEKLAGEYSFHIHSPRVSPPSAKRAREVDAVHPDRSGISDRSGRSERSGRSSDRVLPSGRSGDPTSAPHDEDIPQWQQLGFASFEEWDAHVPF
jgi:hypothetical protein